MRSPNSQVVPGRLELPTATLSVWRSNQLSYRTGICVSLRRDLPSRGCPASTFPQCMRNDHGHRRREPNPEPIFLRSPAVGRPGTTGLQKGGVPAAPSGTATLLRLSPNHQFYPRPVIPVFRHPRLSWLDGRCVQGPGTYSPRHG